MSVALVLWAVPILYAGVQMIEFSAVLTRVSGIASGNHVLSYSVQQSVYMGTRLLFVMLLPLLGFVVDSEVALGTYAVMTHAGLALATLAGLAIYWGRAGLIRYYVRLMEDYKVRGNLFRAFLVFLKRPADPVTVTTTVSMKSVLATPESRRILMLSTLIFSVYGVGMFISFYFALLFYENRAAISQLSGIINALGAVLLTFVVEPRVSQRIDQGHENAADLVMALFCGRLLSVAVAGQVILAVIFIAT